MLLRMTHGHEDPRHGTHPNSAQEWDERYGSADRLWTPNVNPALKAEVTALRPGRALDVGSGEGADARWLAEQGWQVTGLDISQVAIDRCRELDAAGAITWVQADLRLDPVPDPPYDLVSAHYFTLEKAQPGVVDALIAAVAPGGTLLVVAHEAEGVRAHGFRVEDFFQVREVAERLGEGWEIEVLETRERGIPAGGGHHVLDDVLRARRT